MMSQNILKTTTIFVLLLFFVSCSEDDKPIEPETAIETSGLDPTTSVITSWTNLFLELDRYSSGMRPNATARAIAYINLAAYETAIPTMPSYISNAGRLQELTISTINYNEEVNLKLALNACYAKVMQHFMHNSSIINRIDLQENAIEEAVIRNENLRDNIVENSKSWGNYVAEKVIEYSQTDTQAEAQILEPQPLSYEPQVGPGIWSYSADPERALFPYWSSVRTFVISSEETSSVAPVAYSEDVNSNYYQQMLNAYTQNNEAKTSNDEQLWVAEFWSDDVEGLMMSPPGRQISIAKQLIEAYNTSYQSSLELLLKLGFSLNDAAVSTWADKYYYMTMRPSVYIKEFIDPDFETNLYRLVYWPNPSFPSYPSGHSCFASAAAGIFINTFGDAIDFTDYSHDTRPEFLGMPRHFNSFTQMAEENAYSRGPLGVHVRMDCDEGLRLGYEISNAINNYDLEIQ